MTSKQETFCQCLVIKNMTQRQAYLEAYPNAVSWQEKCVDVAACKLLKNTKILLRCEELKKQQEAEIIAEAKWAREDAHRKLTWLIFSAENEIKEKGKISGPCVSAIIDAVKELNRVYAVGEKSEGQGVLEDILAAVRGLGND